MKNRAIKKHDAHNNLLSVIVHFMKRSNISIPDIRDALKHEIDNLDSGSNQSSWQDISAPRIGDDTVESAVMRLWHRLPKYIDVNAAPQPIRLYGKVPSVESLIKAQRVNVQPQLVIKGLISSGLIRKAKGELYLPAEDAATISQLHPIAIEHIAKSVIRMLGTALHNTKAKKTEASLLERSARVPDLDAAEAQEFARFTKTQGLAYLQAVDDWLEARRIAVADAPKKGAPIKSVGAGVHVYAYLGNNDIAAVSADPAGRGEGSFRRSSSEARNGSKRAGAPCTTSGAVA